MSCRLVVLALGFTLVSCGGGGKDKGFDPSKGLPDLIIASLIVDVNGDGKNDIIISDGQPSDGVAAPLVYLNDGAGASFTLKRSAIPTQYGGADSAAVVLNSGDFNNDGKIDLLTIVVSNDYKSSMIQLFLGQGDGTFLDSTSNISTASWPAALPCNTDSQANSWPSYLRVVDIDGDGNLDFTLAFGGAGTCGGVVYRNDGAGHFSVANIAIADGIHSYTSTSLIQAEGYLSTEVLAGDLNMDGKTDFFASTGYGGIQASFLNASTPGHIAFSVVHSMATNPMLQGVLVDINGDEILDVVGSLEYSYPDYSTPRSVNAYIGDGDGGFSELSTVFSPRPYVLGARQFLSADFNGDGKHDVLVINSGPDHAPFPGERNWLLLNDGAGRLVDSTSSSLDLLSAYTHQASIGDLNGDGVPDIILNNSYQSVMSASKEPRFWINNGHAAFSPTSPAFH